MTRLKRAANGKQEPAAKARANYVLKRTARLALAPRRKPYYEEVRAGVTLGYERRNGRNGRWERRTYEPGSDYPYKHLTLGEADDFTAADGASVLSYEHAKRAAAGDVVATGEPITVKRAMVAYLSNLATAKGAAAAEGARQRAEKHIYKRLGHVRVDKLTKRQVEEWQAATVATLEAEARELERPTDTEGDIARRARDTANRILTVLKAALNHAFSDDANRIPSDSAWRKVKAFRGVDGAREDHFDSTQVRTLIAKAATFDKAFAALCEAGFLTGCRLGELTGADVSDFDADNGTLTIRKGKTGARVVTLTAEGVAFLKRLSKNKLPTAILLPRGDGERWGKSEQHRPFKKAAALAELPASASFYSLRHTYISRAIEAGMPLSLVAENCGTSLLMIQKNYAKVLASTRRDVIERTAPRLRRVK